MGCNKWLNRKKEIWTNILFFKKEKSYITGYLKMISSQHKLELIKWSGHAVNFQPFTSLWQEGAAFLTAASARSKCVIIKGSSAARCQPNSQSWAAHQQRFSPRSVPLDCMQNDTESACSEKPISNPLLLRSGTAACPVIVIGHTYSSSKHTCAHAFRIITLILTSGQKGILMNSCLIRAHVYTAAG